MLVNSLLIPCSFLALSLFIPRSSLTCERPILSQITQIIADKTQKHITPQPPLATNCLSLRYNAACCIPLRNQRNLRENWPFTCKGRARNE